MPVQNEQSLVSSSIMSNSLISLDDKSNSVPVFKLNSRAEDKSFLLRSPHKKLFAKTSKAVFSKSNDDKSRQISAFETALSEFKAEGEESMFSAWFSFNKPTNS